MGLGITLGVVGVVILSHAAYSTIQYRGLLQITEEEFSGPPFNVVAELILGFVLCMYAGLTVPGNFHSIHPASEENRCNFFSCSFYSTVWVLCDESIQRIVNMPPCLPQGRGWKGIVSLPENLDFMIFNHRGRVAPSDVNMKLKL